MIFRQLFDQETGTYTYIIGSEKSEEALIIDPVLEQSERDIKYIKELGLKLKYIFETHIHADHITGIDKIKQAFPDAKSVINEKSGVSCADINSKDGEEYTVGDISLKVIFTPGHTDSCTSYYTNGMVFTGDALLIRGCGRTDFQQGNPETLYKSVTEKLFTLPEETLVYPAHDYKGVLCSSIREEKSFNPRLGNNKTVEEFTNIMNNLNLALPKKIHEAVPANMNCGKL